jgi:hypothetical protein
MGNGRMDFVYKQAVLIDTLRLPLSPGFLNYLSILSIIVGMMYVDRLHTVELACDIASGDEYEA